MLGIVIIARKLFVEACFNSFPSAIIISHVHIILIAKISASATRKEKLSRKKFKDSEKLRRYG